MNPGEIVTEMRDENMNMYELCITGQATLWENFEKYDILHNGKRIVYVGDARYYENIYQVEYEDGSIEFLEHESEVELIQQLRLF